MPRRKKTKEQKARTCAGKHSGQANRLINIARRVQAANAAGVTDEKKRLIHEQNICTCAAYVREAVTISGKQRCNKANYKVKTEAGR